MSTGYNLDDLLFTESNKLLCLVFCFFFSFENQRLKVATVILIPIYRVR